MKAVLYNIFRANWRIILTVLRVKYVFFKKKVYLEIAFTTFTIELRACNNWFYRGES